MTNGMTRSQEIERLEAQVSKLGAENAKLREQLEVERPTGICEICTAKSVKELDRLYPENRRLHEENARLRAVAEVV